MVGPRMVVLFGGCWPLGSGASLLGVGHHKQVLSRHQTPVLLSASCLTMGGGVHHSPTILNSTVTFPSPRWSETLGNNELKSSFKLSLSGGVVRAKQERPIEVSKETKGSANCLRVSIF